MGKKNSRYHNRKLWFHYEAVLDGLMLDHDHTVS